MPDTGVSTMSTIPFTMPSLGADMDAGTVIEWLVAPGATVHRGDVVAIVDTDKAELEVEVYDDGTVIDLLVPPGEKVPVGTVLARLAPLASSRSSAPRAPAPSAPSMEPVVVAQPAVRPSVAEPAVTPHVELPVELPVVPHVVPHVEPHDASRAEPHVVSPVLRHLADRLGVDVEHLAGSGGGGRVTRDDIEHAAARPRWTPRARRLARERGVDLAAFPTGRIVTGDDVPHAPAAAAPVAPPTPERAARPSADDRDLAMRRAIATMMTRAWQEIPHYHVRLRVDVQHVLHELAVLNETRPASARVLPGAALASAAARAAAAVPAVNGCWVDGSFVPSAAVHLGIVVSLRSGGLLAPVIRDADTKSLDDLMGEMRDLVTRARSGRLRASEVSGATFTLTALGDREVDEVTPIIHPPQVAILGLGAIHDEAWAEQGMLTVRPVVHATLSADHRSIDGRTGSLYLASFRKHVQEMITP